MMIKKKISVIFAVAVIILSCKAPHNSAFPKILPNQVFLDSIKSNADSIYSKAYTRTDFSNADYFINCRDSTNTQLLKDTAGIIRQIIVAKNKTRIYFAQFYPNGQLMAKYNLDSFGQYNDSCKEYFDNGSVKSVGVYRNGLRTGKWFNYDSTGTLINADEYNKDGQQILHH